MTGDRLKTLEKGFLAGNLTEQEEAELRALLNTTEDHPLKTYFDWTDQEEALVPDLSDKIGKSLAIWSGTFPKVAAILLGLLTAGFLLVNNPFKSKNRGYSQTEIDESYEATMETLTSMARFLNRSLEDTRKGIDLSKPFEHLDELKDENKK